MNDFVRLRSVILACEPQWLSKSLEVDLDVTETTIVADRDLLSQVWTNLIHNAIKFTPFGGSLSIRLATTDDEATVEVMDTGPGIAPEDQLRIFERFYKGDKSRNRTISGSGLGLSIVKKIVELHRGSIGLDSMPGKGSTFRITLPVRLPSTDKSHSSES